MKIVKLLLINLMVTNNKENSCNRQLWFLKSESQLLKKYSLRLLHRSNQPVTGNRLYLSHLTSAVVLL